MSSRDAFFDTTHLGKQLKTRTIRGGAITMAAQVLHLFIGIGSTLVLARLLTPQDYGLVAMVTTVTGFATFFKDLGLAQATIQRKAITNDQVSTMFWINAAASATLTLIVAALAPAVAWFYKRPELTPVMAALSVTFAINGLAIQHQAILTRQMRFAASAMVQLLATSAGVGVAMLCAWHGFRHWALVMQQIAQACALVVGLAIVARWRPGPPVRGCGVRSMLAFGMHVTGFNLVNYFSRNADQMLIGRFCGPTTLGLYSRAYSLLMLPIHNLRNPLSSVALPALSRLQDAPDRFRSAFRKYTWVLAGLSMPLVVFMFLFSREIILLMLGSKWLGASSLFEILAVAAFIQPASSLRGVTLMAAGLGQRYFRLGLFLALANVSAFLAGLPWGAAGVAVSYTAMTYLALLPSLYYSFLDTPLRISDFLAAVARPTCASLAAGAICYVLRQSLPPLPLLATLVWGGICIGSSYLLVWLFIPDGKRQLAELIEHVRLAFSRRAH